MQSTTIWIAASAALALLVGLLVLSVRRRRAAKRRLPSDWAVLPRPVFNLDERRFYRQICTALPGCVVLAKLPLVRLCQPMRPREVRYWYDLLGNIQVSFVICTPMGRVLAVLDIDSGERGASRRAVQIKESVLAACEVRYHRCPAERLPTIAELQQLVPLPAAIPSSSPVAETRDRLASTVKSRRMARNGNGNGWQDSTQAVPDSGIDPSSSLRGDNEAFGAIVVESPGSAVRH